MAVPAPAPEATAPDPRSFRDAMGRLATGVALVTAAPGGEPAGMIVNSVASVSLEPPLLSFCPSRDSLTWARMRHEGRFGVNVLAARHQQFAIRATPPGADRFSGIDWSWGDHGVPRIADALASYECVTVAEHAAGDHWIVVGQVVGLRVSPVDEPLLFFAGGFVS